MRKLAYATMVHNQGAVLKGLLTVGSVTSYRSRFLNSDSEGRRLGSFPRAIINVCIGVALVTCVLAVRADEDAFESQVRPVLIERCLKCHGTDQQEGGLRLDSRDALLQGGDSGAAIVVNEPQASLLLRAIQQEGGLKMPPDGRLTPQQIEAIAQWIKSGATWPESTPSTPSTELPPPDVTLPKLPDSEDLADSLQLWLRADSLQLSDGESVTVWPDQSRHGRDVSATYGIRSGGIGRPGQWVRHSTLMGRPAIRFSPETGLASSAGNPVDLRGDAALTMILVMNLTQFEGPPSHATVFCVGNPAFPTDPGKPLAALLEIDQPQQFSLDFAGGWGHDAVLGPASFAPLFGKPTIVTIVKQPGPMRETTRFYLNGQRVGPLEGQPLQGSDQAPDFQSRSDLGVFLGKALHFCGGIQGDIGEVLFYNTALSEPNRLGVETYLGEKFGLWVDAERMLAAPPQYSETEVRHWAYQPLRPISPPEVHQEAWVRTPLDRFTLARWEAHQLTPPPSIDPRDLLRRASFDLIGLPPTPEEMDSFLSDPSPQAFEKVVDRLLDSPHYGERWGRHWLDLVRYAESTANDANAVMRFAWRYRNYVIDAFNADLPYDQFLIEQLAGDLLPETGSIAEDTRRKIATGYLMIGPKALAETDKEQSRLDIVDDQIDVTGRAMLGLTLSCARCHDHKFDAIRTVDYYAVAGVFRSTEPFQDENRNATMWWEFSIPQGEGIEPIMIMAPKESEPRNLRVHVRGNRFTLGAIVPRGVPGIIAAAQGLPTQRLEPVIDPHQGSSGRLEFARWIASSSNPLTARVVVNRVWQLHFGRGIVATSDNFGTRGEPPTDPELLDWLAGEFLRSGWSIKQLHRMIVLSNTYRMAPLPAELKAALPELSALPMERRRLSAEELRDAFLSVSGQLDRSPGSSESGEFLFSKAEDIGAKIRPNRVAADDGFYSSFRKRSVYLPIVRNLLPEVLSLFDAADPNGVTAIRNQTTVASQGLFLMNHPWVREQSRAFAERVLAESLISEQERIDWAHRLALGRRATEDEQFETQQFLKAFVAVAMQQGQAESEGRLAAWQAFCQALLCSNEFLYVE